MSNQNLCSVSIKPLLLVLSLQILVKNLPPPFLKPPLSIHTILTKSIFLKKIKNCKKIKSCKNTLCGSCKHQIIVNTTSIGPENLQAIVPNQFLSYQKPYFGRILLLWSLIQPLFTQLSFSLRCEFPAVVRDPGLCQSSVTTCSYPWLCKCTLLFAS